MAFNINDPRFQRDIQRASSKAGMRGNRLSRATEDAITGAHAGQQFGRQLQFQSLGLQQKMAEQQFRQANKSRGLRKDALKFDRKLFRDDMANRKSNMRWSLGLGLGTAGLSFLEARRRSNMMNEELAHRRKAEAAYEAQQKTNQALIEHLTAGL